MTPNSLQIPFFRYISSKMSLRILRHTFIGYLNVMNSIIDTYQTIRGNENFADFKISKQNVRIFRKSTKNTSENRISRKLDFPDK